MRTRRSRLPAGTLASSPRRGVEPAHPRPAQVLQVSPPLPHETPWHAGLRTKKPALWRVKVYSGPGLPSPTTSSLLLATAPAPWPPHATTRSTRPTRISRDAAPERRASRTATPRRSDRDDRRETSAEHLDVPSDIRGLRGPGAPRRPLRLPAAYAAPKPKSSTPAWAMARGSDVALGGEALQRASGQASGGGPAPLRCHVGTVGSEGTAAGPKAKGTPGPMERRRLRTARCRGRG
eukprot:scaffold1234_cov248-Pinguiococcus_pyrenoidosus.AAC.3